MPVQNFTLPEVSCPAGQKTVSPSTLINSNPKSILVTLTSSEWDAKAGLGTIRWGVESSPDNVTFTEWFYQPATGRPEIAIGAYGKNGVTIAAIQISGGAMMGMVGYHVQLFAQPTGTAIKLGAQVAVTT